MRKLFVSVGISGSGKSFYYKNKFLSDFSEVANFLTEKGLTLDMIKVCPDDIRREVCGDVSDISKDSYVWRLAESRLKNIIDKYSYGVFDATGVSASGRKIFKKFSDTYKTAIVFEPNVSLSKERITKDISEGVDRSKVPMFVIDRQFESFKSSVVKDLMWDGIWDIDVKKKIIVSLKGEFDEIFFA